MSNNSLALNVFFPLFFVILLGIVLFISARRNKQNSGNNGDKTVITPRRKLLSAVITIIIFVVLRLGETLQHRLFPKLDWAYLPVVTLVLAVAYLVARKIRK